MPDQSRLRRLFNRPRVEKLVSDPYPPEAHPFLQEIGLTGVKRFAGYVWEDFLPNLRYLQGMRIYQQMRDNDATVGAIMFALEMLMRQVRWEVKQGGSEQVDEEAKDFLESCIDDLGHSWTDFLSEAFTMLTYGWSWFEVCYKLRQGKHPGDIVHDSHYQDGRLGWRKFSVRQQLSLLRWEFSPDGDVTHLIQIPPPDYGMRWIPHEKSLHFKMGPAMGSPEGRSLLRNCYRPWYVKTMLENIESIGIERNVAGLPVMRVPLQIASPNDPESEAQLQQWLDFVSSVRKDENMGVVLPSDRYPETGDYLYEFDLVSPSRGATSNTNEIIARWDQRICMSVMADFLLLGSQSVGSFALSDSKTSLFAIALGAILDIVTGVINSTAVPALFALNESSFPGIDKLPEITHGDIRPPDLADLGQYIRNLSDSGMPLFPNAEAENVLLAAANLPQSNVEKSDIVQPRQSRTTDLIQRQLSLDLYRDLQRRMGDID